MARLRSGRTRWLPGLGGLIGIAVAFALIPTRSAVACWGCWDSRAFNLHPAVDAMIPKDGVITFSLGTSGCGDAIWEGLTVEVWTRDDLEPVAGTVTYRGELGAVSFRPTEPFTPGQRIVARAVVGDQVPAPDSLYCGNPERVAEVEVEVVDAITPLPPPPTPSLEVSDEPLLGSFADVACCPGSAPSSDTCSEVYLDMPGCAPMYRQTLQTFGGSLSPVPPGLIASRLIVDGEVVDGSLDGGPLGARRVGPACVALEVEHLGTGEVLRSPVVCTPTEVAATLGVHATDLASALECDAPENCDAGQGNYGWEWDPEACVAIDSLALPPPRGLDDWPRASTCGQGTVVLSGSEEPSQPSAARGCGVTSPGPGTLALVALVALRRRRRAGV